MSAWYQGNVINHPYVPCVSVEFRAGKKLSTNLNFLAKFVVCCTWIPALVSSRVWRRIQKRSLFLRVQVPVVWFILLKYYFKWTNRKKCVVKWGVENVRPTASFSMGNAGVLCDTCCYVCLVSIWKMAENVRASASLRISHDFPPQNCFNLEYASPESIVYLTTMFVFSITEFWNIFIIIMTSEHV